MLKRFLPSKFFPVSQQLTAQQADLLNKLDEFFVGKACGASGPMRLHGFTIPMANQFWPADRLLKSFDVTVFEGYVPRSIALTTQPDGSWLVVVAERVEHEGETDQVKLGLFMHALNQTNNARAT